MPDQIDVKEGRNKKSQAVKKQQKLDVDAAEPRGVVVERFFTSEGRNPFDDVEWEYRSAAITGESGKVYFEQKDCEIPKSWWGDSTGRTCRSTLRTSPPRLAYQSLRNSRRSRIDSASKVPAK